MGAFDTVKEVLSRVGTMQFDKVAMRPGMPQGFGVLGEEQVPVFTLPGNPVSALVSFHVFVAPALRAMAGRPEPSYPPGYVPAVAAEPSAPSPGKMEFLRVVLDDDRARAGRRPGLAHARCARRRRRPGGDPCARSPRSTPETR